MMRRNNKEGDMETSTERLVEEIAAEFPRQELTDEEMEAMSDFYTQQKENQDAANGK